MSGNVETHYVCECGRYWAYATTCVCGRHVPPWTSEPEPSAILGVQQFTPQMLEAAMAAAMDKVLLDTSYHPHQHLRHPQGTICVECGEDLTPFLQGSPQGE